MRCESKESFAAPPPQVMKMARCMPKAMALRAPMELDSNLDFDEGLEQI